MKANAYDVIVIGGGPGGYAAAVRSSNHGFKTALIEKEALGGTCVNWGCIPTKAMLKSAKNIYHQQRQKIYDYRKLQHASFDIVARQKQRIQRLMKSSNVTLIAGEASLLSANEVEIRPTGERITGRSIILATGCVARKLSGVVYDADTIVTTQEVWNFTQAPKTAAVIGCGPTGMEFVTLWERFGTKVTALEAASKVMPNEDEEIAHVATDHLRHLGVNLLTGVQVESVIKGADGVTVTFSGAAGKQSMVVEKVLISIGIVPNVANLGLERAGIAMGNNCIEINDRMQTNVPHIYAIGDVTGKLDLGMVAVMQGNHAADAIAGKKTKKIEYMKLPRCVYADPEVSSAGMTEKGAREAGYKVRITRKPLEHGKSLSTQDDHGGFIKLIEDESTGILLGAHLIGHNAIDLIGGPAALVGSGEAVPQGEDVLFAV